MGVEELNYLHGQTLLLMFLVKLSPAPKVISVHVRHMSTILTEDSYSFKVTLSIVMLDIYMFYPTFLCLSNKYQQINS